jgi:hypothetical protein
VHHVVVRCDPVLELGARPRLAVDRDQALGLGQAREEGDSAAVEDPELEHPLRFELADELGSALLCAPVAIRPV